MQERKKVIVDTDFIKYMDRPHDGSGIMILEKLVNDLEIELIVHEFLYKKELMGTPIAKKLVEQELLTIVSYQDFVDTASESYYKKTFEDMYNYCNGREIVWKNNSYSTYQESGANLGEIHSIILAMYTGYDVFFSNDNGSKALVKVKVNTGKFSISVKNIMDVFREIAVMKDKSLTKKDFVKLTNGDTTRKTEIDRIKGIWIDN